MSNLTQNIQNFFIRSVAFFSVILKSFTDFIKNFFGFFGSLIGFTPSDYFLESDEAQGTKRSNAKQEIAKEQNNIAETPTTNNRKKAKIDNYFLNMAREVKKS